MLFTEEEEKNVMLIINPREFYSKYTYTCQKWMIIQRKIPQLKLKDKK